MSKGTICNGKIFTNENYSIKLIVYDINYSTSVKEEGVNPAVWPL